jgi:hypothetical protein
MIPLISFISIPAACFTHNTSSLLPLRQKLHSHSVNREVSDPRDKLTEGTELRTYNSGMGVYLPRTFNRRQHLRICPLILGCFGVLHI